MKASPKFAEPCSRNLGAKERGRKKEYGGDFGRKGIESSSSNENIFAFRDP